MTTCITDEVIEALRTGHLAAESARERQALAHLATCADCERRLHAISPFTAPLSPPGLLSPAGSISPVGSTSPAGPDSLAALSPPSSVDPARPPRDIAEFLLVRPLGKGANGHVYLAEDRKLIRPVALKFLTRGRSDDAHAARFLREARAIARLSHPNVVMIHQVAEISGTPFLVSEYIRGNSLEKLERPLPWRRVLRLGMGLARGLRAAHRGDVLHRDIKPANAILPKDEADEHVKLLDFGLAKLLDDLNGDVQTQSTDIVGTPRYLAPEAWSSTANLTRASDIYSLGAILYELTAGVPPHPETGMAALSYAAVHRDVLPLRSLVPDCNEDFAQVVDRCLRRDPAARFADAMALCDALEALEGRESTIRTVPPPRRRRALAAAGVVTGAAALALGLARWPRYSPAQGSAVSASGSMQPFPASTVVMGSTDLEVDGAVDFCQQWRGEHCPRSDFAVEAPRRQVQIAAFWFDRLEVDNQTFAAWLNRQPDLRVAANGDVRQSDVLLLSAAPTIGFGLLYSDGHWSVRPGLERWPVTQVTWRGAARYCESLGKRLPSEAEWEFAARGPERRTFPWGEEWPLCDQVVFARRASLACGHAGRQPAPVGSAAQDRTRDGVSDLGGNVAEWVADRFVTSAPQAGATPLRVVRGGSWGDAASVRASMRAGRMEDEALNNVGLRCAASAPPP